MFLVCKQELIQSEFERVYFLKRFFARLPPMASAARNQPRCYSSPEGTTTVAVMTGCGACKGC